MSKILCLDTSTSSTTVALTMPGQRGLSLPDNAQHCAELLPSIEKLLGQAQLKLHDLDGFSVVLGPGSFTGLRIALALVKAFAWALNKPCVGHNALQLLLRQAQDYQENHHAAVIYARRGHVYGLICHAKTQAILLRDQEYAIKDFVAALPPSTVLMGSTVPELESALLECQSAESILRVKQHLSQESLAQAALACFARKDFLDIINSQPEYYLTEVAQA